MGWVRVSDDFYDHPAHVDLDLSAWGLWLWSLAWANRNLTDGVLPLAAVRRMDPDGTASGALITAGRWVELDDGRVRVHDFEVDRLRAALRRIERSCEIAREFADYRTLYRQVRTCEQIARKAIGHAAAPQGEPEQCPTCGCDQRSWVQNACASPGPADPWHQEQEAAPPAEGDPAQVALTDAGSHTEQCPTCGSGYRHVVGARCVWFRDPWHQEQR